MQCTTCQSVQNHCNRWVERKMRCNLNHDCTVWNYGGRPAVRRGPSHEMHENCDITLLNIRITVVG